MSLPWDVTKNDLDILLPEESVELITKIIRSEAVISEIEQSKIDISSNIDTPDGGIDGTVKDIDNDSVNGIIKKGNNNYQIKSGNFSLGTKCIRELLFKSDDKNLKPKIKSCLENNERLVFIFTGWDGPSVSDIQNKIFNQIPSEYNNPQIDIWVQNIIIGFLKMFPALTLWVLKLHDVLFITHEQWSNFSDMQHDIFLNSKQKTYVKKFRSELYKKTTDHIRVIGEPGLGKSRIVLKITDDPMLKSLVIYCEDPTKFMETGFLSNITRPNTKSYVILIIDDCDYDSQTRIWSKLKNQEGIKLVTIFNEKDPNIPQTNYLEPPSLGDDEIGQILDSYKIQKHKSKWIEFCKPSPRITHMIGINLQSSHDVFASPDDINGWDRCIAHTNKINTPEFEKRKIILMWISLFHKFGFGAEYNHELKIISNIIEKKHGNIKSGDIAKVILDLKNMKLLQGNNTLYITPKMLHIKFLLDWWNTYGNSISDLHEELENEYKQFPDQERNLIYWYEDMFEYAKKSAEVIPVIENYLKPYGIFEKKKIMDQINGSRFFLKLSIADPEKSLEFLKRFISSKTITELKTHSHWRRNVVWALQRTSMKKELFADSATLLLKLGIAENENYSNNASGIFTGLFSPGSGAVAPTEMHPKERIPVIEYALSSDSIDSIKLGIQACENALQSNNFMGIDVTSNDLLDDFKPWNCKSIDEIYDYYKNILDILWKHLKKSKNTSIIKLITDVILKKALFLIVIDDISEKILEMIENMYDSKNIDNETIFENIQHILNYSDKPTDANVKSRLKKIQANIIGNTYHSKLLRYVGMNNRINLFGNKEDDKIQEIEVERLAKESLNIDTLKPELKWLVSASAKNGFEFGKVLGKIDVDFQLLSLILDEQRSIPYESAGVFIHGYFISLYQLNIEKYNSHIEIMCDDSILCKFIPHIITITKITDKSCRHILSLLEKSKIMYSDCNVLQYCSSISEISEPLFLKLISKLLNYNENDSILLALELFNSYYIYKHEKPKTLPCEFTLLTLFNKTLMDNSAMLNYTYGLDQLFKEIISVFLEQYPTESTNILKKILERFTSDSFFVQHGSGIYEILDGIVMSMPIESWNIILKYVTLPLDQRSSNIILWLNGGIMHNDLHTRIFSNESMSHIIKWVDEDVSNRALCLAHFIPSKFTLVRQVISKYWENKSVSNIMYAKLNTEMYSGSASVHYEQKKQTYQDYLKNETDHNVKSWLNEYLSDIENTRRRSENEEERLPF